MIDPDTTVILTASPIPSHPSTEVIDQTLASVRAHLPTAEVLVLCDGVAPEVEHRAEDYAEFCRRFVWACAHRHERTVPFLHETHVHQAAMVTEALAEVTTPLLLFMEHDTPLCPEEIDWRACADAIRSGALNLVRFHHEAQIPREHAYLMVDAAPRTLGGLRHVRTAQFSARPHLASAAYYRNLLASFFGPDDRTFLEDRVHGPISEAWRLHGIAGWEQHRLAIYHPEGVIKRSEHTDGRGEDPKVAT